MKPAFYAFIIGSLILASGHSLAQAVQDAEAWERDEAWRASSSVDTRATRNQLQQLVLAGDNPATLQLIRDIELKDDWPLPARERLIFDFVNDLRQQSPRIISANVTGYLSEIQPRVLVPHEDHPRSAVPLFNIKGAIKGVENGWTRQEAAFEGAAQLLNDPEILVTAFASEQNYNRRQGFLDALANASSSELKSVSHTAMSGLSQNPDLLELAGRSALLGNDLETVTRLAKAGEGRHMQQLFSGAVKTFSTGELYQIFESALKNSSSETSALAIAQLAPTLIGNEVTETLLFNTLGDAQLGSTAALALVAKPNERILSRLESIAGMGSGGLKAVRARLALDIHMSRTVVRTQQ
jgi:hypothetical protein